MGVERTTPDDETEDAKQDESRDSKIERTSRSVTITNRRTAMKTLKTLSLVSLTSLVLVGGSAMNASAQDDRVRPRAATTIQEEYVAGDNEMRVIGPDSRPAPRLGFNGTVIATGLRVEGVDYGSLAFDAGLERGDVITSVNGRRIQSMSGYRRALCDAVDHNDGRVRLVIENVRWHTGESSIRYVTRTIHLPHHHHGGGGGGGGFDG